MTSREEYLKRYLSGDKAKEKKTKKKNHVKIDRPRFKIIEDDVDVLPDITVSQAQNDEFVESDEDEIKPVVTLLNNETDELKLLGKFKIDNWKSIGVESRNETEYVQIDEKEPGPGTSTVQQQDDEDVPRRGVNSVNDDEEALGRGASTVYRRKMTVSKSKRRREPTEEEKQRAEEMAKKYAVWNKGQKQIQEREQKLEEMAAEVSKPFARHRGDEDLEEHLKSIEYKDDPMLQYMREKKSKDTGSTSKPTYKGPWPPNRYGIPPGYRWDGVDRSNGFEVKLMSLQNIKKADEEEFYKWTSGRYE